MKKTIVPLQKLTRNSRSLTEILAAQTIVLLLVGVSSHAGNIDQSIYQFEEIVITARKRVEPIHDVPIAITAIPKFTMTDGNLDSMEEYMELVPNMVLPKDGWSSSDISIRGSSRISGDEDPGVGINVDGVYIGGLLTAFSNFFDIDRVEVMRGPQAGLYGRNAVGGAVNVMSVRPDYIQSGYLDMRLGNLDHREVRGAANLIVIDERLAVRVSGLYLDRQKGFNYVENQDQYLDAYRNQSARARLLFTPSIDLEFLTTITGFSSDGAILAGVPGPGVSVAGLSGVGIIAGTDEDETRRLRANFPQKNTVQQRQIIQEVNWEWRGGTVTGIFSYRDTEAETLLDFDRTTIDLREHHLDSNQESAFAEVRYSTKIDDFHIIAGVTYLDENLSLGVDSVLGGEFGLDFAGWYTTGLVGPNPFGIPVGESIAALGLTPLGNAGGWSGALGDVQSGSLG